MRYYNRLKVYIRFALVFAIIYAMLIGVDALIERNVYDLLLSSIAIFAVIIPLYYSAYLLEKQNVSIDDSLKDFFAYINNTIKIKDFSDDGFEDKFSNDKNLSKIYEYIKENKKVLFDMRKKDELLNEILISTALNHEIEKFLDDVMPKIMDITQSQFIVFYAVNKATNKLEVKASVGFGKNIYSQFDISMGEGFVGQAAASNKIVVVRELDDDSVYVTKTFLGDIMPKNIAAFPVNNIDDENDILGVFAIGSIYEYTDSHLATLEEVRKYTAYAVINGVFYNKNLRLTNELKFQNQLIQNLNEDLELKIKERTEIFDNIINSIKDYAVIYVDKMGVVVMINDSAIEKFNLTKERVVGKSIFKVTQIVPYIDDKSQNYIDIALKTGKAKFIHNFRNKTGEDKLVEVEMFAVKDEFSEVSGVTIIINDIRYIQKNNSSESVDKRIFDVMFEESANSIIVVSPDLTIEKISKNAEYLIGIDKVKISGMLVYDIFMEKDDVCETIQNIFMGIDIKNLSATAINTKIKINMRFRLIEGTSENPAKLMIYL